MTARTMIIALLALLAACSPQKLNEDMLAQHTPDALIRQANADIDRLVAEGRLALEPPATLAGYRADNSIDERPSAVISFQGAADERGRYTLVTLHYLESHGKYLFDSVEVSKRRNSAFDFPLFRLSDGSPLGWLFAALGIAALLTSLTAAILAARTEGLGGKWLWVIGSLATFGSFSAGWSSGSFGIGIGLQLLGFGATAQIGGAEWVVSFGLPLIAILFLLLRSAGRLGAKAAS